MHLLLTVLICLFFSSFSFADNSLGLPPLIIPAENQQTAEKIALGRLLFNDKRFSADGSISCASCHQEHKAFTDALPQAVGINGQSGTRNTPTVVNAAFFDTFFLDGREPSLEGQALGPLINPIEHGLRDPQIIIDIIRRDKIYLPLFKQVFAITKEEISIVHVVNSIASYERTLVAGNSAFDRYLFGKDKSALTPAAARGLKIFRRKGNCANCHEISWNNALFSDNRFYNIGVGFKRLQPVLDELLDNVKQGADIHGIRMSASQRSELGRFNITGVLADLGKFKTPTLRNVALTAPYMHDGSMTTLAEVVDYYDKGGDQNRFIDPAVFPLQLTIQEKADLVEFLQALTSAQYVPHDTLPAQGQVKNKLAPPIQ